ncbi:hypothetical protein [Hahella ganghwensis]|uniref:hypothetical protein n=1 Tax=Hahella ganghwensis TaxID=286420 RepID=UPI000367ED41|nr:hypothetical protein [Hahella ganghwensis]
MSIRKLRNLRFQWYNSVSEGRQLELFAADEDGRPLKGIQYPLLSILADEQSEELLIEFSTSKGIVQVPVSEVKAIIEAASGEVHSESWYEKNVYSRDENK